MIGMNYIVIPSWSNPFINCDWGTATP